MGEGAKEKRDENDQRNTYTATEFAKESKKRERLTEGRRERTTEISTDVEKR